MNFTKITSGERIKKLRIYLGLTLEEFGDKLGVTRTAISNIEKGHRNLTNQMIKSICREFNVNYEWLVHGNSEMFNCDKDELTSITNQVQRIMNGDNEYHKTLLKLVLSLNEEQLELFLKLRNFAK